MSINNDKRKKVPDIWCAHSEEPEAFVSHGHNHPSIQGSRATPQGGGLMLLAWFQLILASHVPQTLRNLHVHLIHSIPTSTCVQFSHLQPPTQHLPPQTKGTKDLATHLHHKIPKRETHHQTLVVNFFPNKIFRETAAAAHRQSTFALCRIQPRWDDSK